MSEKAKKALCLQSAEVIDAMPGGEVLEKRTETAKVFALSEDTYQAVLYPYPIHVKNKGTQEWEEIDNTLVTQTDGGGAYLANRSNAQMKVRLRGKDAPWLVALENGDGDTLRWRMKDVEASSDKQEALEEKASACTRAEGFVASRPVQAVRIKEDGEEAAPQPLRAQAIAERVNTAAELSQVLPGVNMKCHVEGTVFKDEFVFEAAEAVRPIALAVNAPGLSLTLREDRTIVAKSAAQVRAQSEAAATADDAERKLPDLDGILNARQEETAFALAAPYAIDANGEIAPVLVTLRQDGEADWTLTYTLDSEWAETAHYPVTLDPTVTTGAVASAMQRNLVSSRYPDTVYNNPDALQLAHGYIVTAEYKQIGFIRFDPTQLPVIDSSYMMTHAALHASVVNNSAYHTNLFVNEVTLPYNAAILTYNNRPPVSEIDEDYCRLGSMYENPGNLPQDPALGVTRLVRKWYANPSLNYGLCVQIRNEGTGQMATMSAPYLAMTYVSKAGIEGHHKYESFSLGRAGTASVNLYNGNLVFSHSDTSSGGSRMPISISHFYNSCEYNIPQYYAGRGWKFSLQEVMRKEMLQQTPGGGQTPVYVHTRADGSKAYYGSNGEDLSGTFNTFQIVTLPSGQRVVRLTSKMDSVAEFPEPTVVSNGRDMNYTTLQTLRDAVGNQVTVANIGTGVISRAVDGAGRATTFSYIPGQLSNVKGPGDTNGCTFTYDAARNLTGIQHEDGLSTAYAYNAQGLLSMVTNIDGRRLSFLYTATAPYRVIRVTESTVSGETGNSRYYEYNGNMTTVTDMTVPNGKKKLYCFNNQGNVISASDELGHAVATEYREDYPANHPAAASRTLKAVANLLRNPRFEAHDGWVFHGSPNPIGGFIEDNAYLGYRCAWLGNYGDTIQRYMAQTVNLTPGKTYTFSCYVKRQGNIGLTLAHHVVDTQQGDVWGETPDLRQDTESGEYVRVSHTFTLPLTAATGATTLCVITKGQGVGATVRMDAAQLEEAPVASRFNLLENGDFGFNVNGKPEKWEELAGNSEIDLVYPIGQGKPEGYSPNALRLHGSPVKQAGIYQDIDMGGKKDTMFTIGGWAKAMGAQLRGRNKLCSMRIGFYTLPNGLLVEPTEEARWSDTWTDWHFAAAAVTAPADFYKIRVFLEYQGNINWADFGGLFVDWSEYGSTFEYDAKGNVLSTKNTAKQYTRAQYDAFNNMISFRVGEKVEETTTYSYGETDAEKRKHLLKASRSPSGIYGEYLYDAAGNPTLSKMRNVNGTGPEFMLSTTGYTADLNHVASRTNERGKISHTTIDSQKDITNAATTPSGQTVSYAYDNLRRTIGVVVADDGKTYRNAYTYANERITSARHNTMDANTCDVQYHFEYDALGNPTRTRVGSQMLSTNVYTDTGDKLLQRTDYGNGGKVRYGYDSYKRLKKVYYDTETIPRFVYDYDTAGRTARVTDNGPMPRVTTMELDAEGRASHMQERTEGQVTFTQDYVYNEENELSDLRERAANGVAYKTSITYDNERRPTWMSLSRNDEAYGFIGVHYDGLGRIRQRGIGSYNTDYTYVAGGHGVNSTTGLVQTITQSGENFSYTHDDNGNITTVHRNNVMTAYSYDGIGQLIREDDPVQNRTILYRYDQGGNLLDKKAFPLTWGLVVGSPLETTTYSYEDANWKDKLTKVNGVGITYDAIGNPLNDGKWQYVWEAGRQLKSLSRNGEQVSFLYGSDGMRKRKQSTSRGITDYTYSGSKLVHMTRGGNDLHFWYDDLGRPALVWYNDKAYSYIYNAQDDVIGILDQVTGNRATYTYDTWGKQLSCTGALAATLGKENPFRYRGYVYDEETGLYALPARYYNPEWKRWVNADSLLEQGKLLGHNLFSYCKNNPANSSDPSGRKPEGFFAGIWKWLKKVFGGGYTGPELNPLTSRATDKGRPAINDVMDLEDKVKGYKDVTVENIQKLLEVGGYLDEKWVDGVYGDFTKDAVEAFQKDYNAGELSYELPKGELSVDGWAGDDTQWALFYVFGEMDGIDWGYLKK